VCVFFFGAQVHQSDLQRMQNIAQRRQASLQFYREQYDSSHAVLPSVNPSSAPRSFDRRYDGEGQDEIDAVEGYDEIDCVQKSSSAMDFSPWNHQALRID